MTNVSKNADPKIITLDSDTEVVASLPYPITTGTHFHIEGNGTKQFTHSLFTFPAKFHAPIVQWGLENFSTSNSLVLDPFNGSATVQVEALASGRDSVGLDIDPVAVFISQVKTTPIKPDILKRFFKMILEGIAPYRRSSTEYEDRQFPQADITLDEFNSEASKLWIPEIPNIMHWFRRYVVIDLARLNSQIYSEVPSLAERNFFLAIFAAVIRRCSNADPVPVSGLEYTKHMRERDQRGRIIDPFTIFEQKARKEIDGMAQLWDVTRPTASKTAAVGASDIRQLHSALPKVISKYWKDKKDVDLIITSPPYCNAVDYHTRNKLEAFWLKLVKTQDEYLTYYSKYIGRRRVKRAERNPNFAFDLDSLNECLANVREHNADQAEILTTYFIEMRYTLSKLATVLQSGNHLLLFIGDSQSARQTVHTHEYIRHFASQHFDLITEFSYNIPNRFMSYERHNGANIKVEWGFIFKKV